MRINWDYIKLAFLSVAVVRFTVLPTSETKKEW